MRPPMHHPSHTLQQQQALAEVAALLFMARAVEPIYGSTEMLRFIMVVALTSSVATFAVVYVIYLVSPLKEGTVL